MQQLIDRLTEKYSISAEQATGILGTIKEYAEQKVPGLGNSLNSILQENTNPSAESSNEKQQGFFDKATHYVEEHIPAGLKEKTEEVLEGVGSKIKGMFN
ncbi:MAG: hypothetical protein ABI675_12865 [Chitinophagaceae bacterium]